jgi:hypothetical protein
MVTDNLAEMVLNRIKAFALSALTRRREVMKTLLHFRTHDGGLFHSHPFHSAFALIASFVLAMLCVLLFVATAR